MALSKRQEWRRRITIRRTLEIGGTRYCADSICAYGPFSDLHYLVSGRTPSLFRLLGPPRHRRFPSLFVFAFYGTPTVQRSHPHRSNSPPRPSPRNGLDELRRHVIRKVDACVGQRRKFLSSLSRFREPAISATGKRIRSAYFWESPSHLHLGPGPARGSFGVRRLGFV